MAEEARSPDNTDAARNSNAKRGNRRRKWYLLGLTAVFLLISTAYLAWYLLVAQYYAQTNDAYVHGNQVALTPQRAGTVTAIHADDTDRVGAGDTDVDNALDNASAGLAQAIR